MQGWFSRHLECDHVVHGTKNMVFIQYIMIWRRCVSLTVGRSLPTRHNSPLYWADLVLHNNASSIQRDFRISAEKFYMAAILNLGKINRSSFQE